MCKSRWTKGDSSLKKVLYEAFTDIIFFDFKWCRKFQIVIHGTDNNKKTQYVKDGRNETDEKNIDVMISKSQ